MFKNTPKVAKAVKAFTPPLSAQSAADEKPLVEEASAPRPVGIEPAPVIAVASEDQAPVIAFAPYQNDMYDASYSSTLLAKSNALAVQIWNGEKGYYAAKGYMPHRFDPQHASEEEIKEASVVGVKNDRIYPRFEVIGKIKQALDITSMLSYSNPVGYFQQRSTMLETIKKLKRLEKKHEDSEIIDEEGRDRIINSILFPPQANVGYFQTYVDFRYPPQRGVINQLITAEEMQMIESILNYLPRVRLLLSAWNVDEPNLTTEELLLPILDDGGEKLSFNPSENNARFIKRLRQMHHFFNVVVPYAVKEDHIKAISYPTPASLAYRDVQAHSAKMREASLGYVREEKSLSDILEPILNFSNALQDYFEAVAGEIRAYFDYLNKIDLAYDTLVLESEEKIKASILPF